MIYTYTRTNKIAFYVVFVAKRINSILIFRIALYRKQYTSGPCIWRINILHCSICKYVCQGCSVIRHHSMFLKLYYNYIIIKSCGPFLPCVLRALFPVYVISYICLSLGPNIKRCYGKGYCYFRFGSPLADYECYTLVGNDTYMSNKTCC